MPTSILVVESNSKLRELIWSALHDKGMDVVVADTLQEARRMLVEHTPRVIVLDAEVPDGDAGAFCASLRHEGPRIPVILISADGSEDSVVQALEAGADDYLVKPFGIGELAARVAGQLRHSRSGGPANPYHLAA